MALVKRVSTIYDKISYHHNSFVGQMHNKMAAYKRIKEIEDSFDNGALDITGKTLEEAVSCYYAEKRMPLNIPAFNKHFDSKMSDARESIQFYANQIILERSSNYILFHTSKFDKAKFIAEVGAFKDGILNMLLNDVTSDFNLMSMYKQDFAQNVVDDKAKKEPEQDILEHARQELSKEWDSYVLANVDSEL